MRNPGFWILARRVFRVRVVLWSRVLLPGVALCWGCAFPEEGHAPPPPPRVDFAELRHDFGRVEQGAVVEHAFRLTNEGGSPLVIENLRTACGCAAVASSGEVASGEAAVVEIRCDTGDVFGSQRRTVTVHTNDPERAATVLELQGEVSLDVAADPVRLYAGRVRPGDRVRREILVLAADSVRIESVVSGGGPLAVASSELADGRRGRAVRLHVAADAAPGPFRQEVLVRTSSARHPVLRIPVTGRVDGEAGSDAATRW